MKKWKKICLIAANALCLLCIGAGAIVLSVLGNTLLSQQAAEAWRGDNEMQFAQVSVFLPVGGELTESKIQSFRSSLDTKLAEAGIEEPEEGSLWTDAYCAIGSATVASSRGSSSATAIGIGGDYFLFHPLELFSGHYISGDDQSKDLVLIDETLAWRLYGGTDLEGMSLTVNGEPCLIAGVVKLESDFATEHALEEGTPMIFMAYERLGTKQEEGGVQEAGASAYEIVMPNPLTGYAKSVVAEGIGSADGVITVENSRRYSGGELRTVLSEFGERGMRKTAIVFPYWENAARYVESWMALVYLLMLLFAILPVITLIWLGVRLFRLSKRLSRRGLRLAGEKLEDRKERRWLQKQQGKRVARGRKKTASAVSTAPLEAEENILPVDVESIVQEILEDNARRKQKPEQ